MHARVIDFIAPRGGIKNDATQTLFFGVTAFAATEDFLRDFRKCVDINFARAGLPFSFVIFAGFFVLYCALVRDIYVG